MNTKNIILCSKRNNAYIASIIFLTAVLFIVFICTWLVLTWIRNEQHLLLSKLVITGECHYTRNDDIRKSVLSLGLQGAFIMQDVNLIKNQIERLSWIKQAKVRKQWPDALKIYLIEYIPIAYWNNHHMIDIDGNSFSIPSDHVSKQDLPILYGPEGSKSKVVHDFCKMRQVLVRNGFTLKMAIMTTHHSWQIILLNSIKLYLGRNDTMNRLTRFIELYPILLQQAQNNDKQISYIDLRYNSGAAVGWTKIPEPNQRQKQAQIHGQNNND